MERNTLRGMNISGTILDEYEPVATPDVSILEPTADSIGYTITSTPYNESVWAREYTAEQNQRYEDRVLDAVIENTRGITIRIPRSIPAAASIEDTPMTPMDYEEIQASDAVRASDVVRELARIYRGTSPGDGSPEVNNDEVIRRICTECSAEQLEHYLTLLDAALIRRHEDANSRTTN